MNFDLDVFVSYAHLDDAALVEDQKGWVAKLHRDARNPRLAQLLGKSPRIWRDPKLQGNDVFAETLVDRLKRAAVLVSVVSPRYVRSEWTTRELNEFCKAAEQQGGVQIAAQVAHLQGAEDAGPARSAIRRSCGRCSATSSSRSIRRTGRSASSTRCSGPRPSGSSG